jgi:hypothetical protein
VNRRGAAQDWELPLNPRKPLRSIEIMAHKILRQRIVAARLEAVEILREATESGPEEIIGNLEMAVRSFISAVQKIDGTYPELPPPRST